MSCVYLSPLLTVLLYPPAVSQPRAGTRSCECAFLLSPYYAQVLPNQNGFGPLNGCYIGCSNTPPNGESYWARFSICAAAGNHAQQRQQPAIPSPGQGARSNGL